ncbi:hypothetical protein PV04_03496 [Phialophora macrospora]|uniref:MARVEL domain-containing protein n=1 Tax=Phialophora macrospora TaxID=1851006 RepID=A0A0D2GGD4_9EURO|nr:hypothetical protein PV04_03496 [Phialophora macrospora]
MLSPGTLTAIVIFQLLLGFVALILAAFSAVCFGAEFAYGVVWWSLGWTLATACLRWWAYDFGRSVVEQTVHLAFESFALIDWVVATGVLAALNVRLNNLRKEYDFDVDHNIALTDELVTHQFAALGMGGLYCSYALNAIAGVIVVLFLISILDSFRLLRMSMRVAKNDVEKEYKYGYL